MTSHNPAHPAPVAGTRVPAPPAEPANTAPQRPGDTREQIVADMYKSCPWLPPPTLS